MLPYKADSSTVFHNYAASSLVDGDISTYHATNNNISSDAWMRVYFTTKVILIIEKLLPFRKEELISVIMCSSRKRT